jgi:alkanesulfonate monooxygenase SsuD/methylene tetrahydromethanopterin reductase-like flavin-dependent oxidoreductase (luciferase family)
MQLICSYHVKGPRPLERAPYGAALVGDPDEVVEKIVRYSKALGDLANSLEISLQYWTNIRPQLQPYCGR